MPLEPVSFAADLLGWYDAARRDLPWRTPPGRLPDPYHVLLSETMLQQTQVVTVIPYFHRFLKKFPTIEALAAADLQEVLRLWQGLGYYSRAKNLHKAAQAVVNSFSGKLPTALDDLLALPGVGRYTAGAIASLAFDLPAPILDGNVQRVLCRLEAITADPRDRSVNARLWQLAGQILPERRAGDFNSAMMELGAMLCTPRNPQCLLCPVRRHCQAVATGIAEQIPMRRKSKPTPLHHRNVYCIESDGRWLIEQRPPTGRWAGMWQFLTREASEHAPAMIEIDGRRFEPRAAMGTIRHVLTHRRYEFHVRLMRPSPSKGQPHKLPEISALASRWASLEELDRYPMPRPHVKIAGMLRDAARP